MPNIQDVTETNDQNNVGTVSPAPDKNLLLNQLSIKLKTNNKTANFTVPANQTGTLYSNTGASAQVIFTLPDAVAGLVFAFANDAAQTLRIQAQTGDFIRIGGNSSSGGSQSTSSIGNSVTLAAISSTQWIAIGGVGAWTAT